jgi:DNA polymerase III alpha subunit
MWADAYEKYADFIKSGTVVFMRGRVDRSRSIDTNSPDGNFIVDEAFTPDAAPKKLCRGLAITLDEERHSRDSVESLLKILRENPGGEPVELSLRLKDGTTARFSGNKTTVAVTPGLHRRLTEFLGTDSAKVLIKMPPPKKAQNGYRRV